MTCITKPLGERQVLDALHLGKSAVTPIVALRI